MCKHSKAVCVHNNLRFAKTYSITMWDTVQSQVTRLRVFPVGRNANNGKASESISMFVIKFDNLLY